MIFKLNHSDFSNSFLRKIEIIIDNDQNFFEIFDNNTKNNLDIGFNYIKHFKPLQFESYEKIINYINNELITLDIERLYTNRSQLILMTEIIYEILFVDVIEYKSFFDSESFLKNNDKSSLIQFYKTKKRKLEQIFFEISENSLKLNEEYLKYETALELFNGDCNHFINRYLLTQ